MDKKTIQLATFLSIIAIICAGLISSVHNLTNPIIEATKQAEKEATILEFFPTMTSFKESDVSDQFDSIQVIYEIYDCSNALIGRIYELVAKGYGGKLNLFIAYDLNTKELINLRYIGSFNETPGFGSRVKEDEFLSQVMNKKVNEMQIDTLSGATITSSAVKKAIEESNAHVLTHGSK